MIYSDKLKHVIWSESQRVRDSTLKELKDRYCLNKHISNEYVEGIIKGFELISNAINNTVECYEEWIFCADKQPTVVKNYLVTVYNTKTNEISEKVAKWNGNTWPITAVFSDLIVICWHEIPPAYKGKRIKEAINLAKSDSFSDCVEYKDYKVYRR